MLLIVGRAFGGGPFRRQIIYFKFLDALQSDRSVAVTDDDDDDVLMIMIVIRSSLAVVSLLSFHVMPSVLRNRDYVS